MADAVHLLLAIPGPEGVCLDFVFPSVFKLANSVGTSSVTSVFFAGILITTVHHRAGTGDMPLEIFEGK